MRSQRVVLFVEITQPKVCKEKEKETVYYLHRRFSASCHFNCYTKLSHSLFSGVGYMHKINGAVLSRYYVSSMLQKLSSVLCIYLVVIPLHGHSHPSMLVFDQMIPCIPKKINLIPRRSQAVRQACEEQVSSVLLSPIWITVVIEDRLRVDTPERPRPHLALEISSYYMYHYLLNQPTLHGV